MLETSALLKDTTNDALAAHIQMLRDGLQDKVVLDSAIFWIVFIVVFCLGCDWIIRHR